jgi:hypothetical protein
MQIVPVIAQRIGWRWGFTVLALGPAVGIAAIRKLRGASAPQGIGATFSSPS